MSKIVIEKDFDVYECDLCETTISLSLDNSLDSTLVSRSIRDNRKGVFENISITDNILHVHIIDKLLPIKSKDKNKEPDLSKSYVSLITKLSLNIQDALKDYCEDLPDERACDFLTLKLFKILYIAVVADTTELSCNTVFPCDVGEASVESELNQLDLMRDNAQLSQMRRNDSYWVDDGYFDSYTGMWIDTSYLATPTNYAVAGELAESTKKFEHKLGMIVGAVAVATFWMPPFAIAAGLISHSSLKYARETDVEMIKANTILDDYMRIASKGRISKYIEDNKLSYAQIWKDISYLATATGSSSVFELEDNIQYVVD